MLAGDWGRDELVEVHGAEAFDAGWVAVRAGCGGVDVPEVGEDSSAIERKAVGCGCFERGEFWRRETACGLESFHGSVACAGGDEGGCGGSAVEGEVEGASGPFDGLFFAHEGWLDEDEDAEVDVVSAEEVCGFCEVIRGHALVEFGEDLRVDGFEAHGYFQFAI